MVTGYQVPDDINSHAHAGAMGFVVPVEEDVDRREALLPSAASYAKRVAEPEREDWLATAIRQKALVNVDRLNNLIMRAALDASAPLRTRMDVLDQQIKLSGAAARNQAKESVAGATFSIQITIPSGSGGAPTIIESTAVKVPDEEV